MGRIFFLSFFFSMWKFFPLLISVKCFHEHIIYLQDQMNMNKPSTNKIDGIFHRYFIFFVYFYAFSSLKHLFVWAYIIWEIEKRVVCLFLCLSIVLIQFFFHVCPFISPIYGLRWDISSFCTWNLVISL